MRPSPEHAANTSLLANPAGSFPASSEALLAAIIESSNDAIISKNLHGIITSWNKSAERIFGYRAEEAIGQPISLLAAPGRHNEMPDILARIRRGERIEHYETVRRRKDGELVSVSLSISPLRNEAGEIVGASKVARDITEAKRAKQALRETHQRLEAIITASPLPIVALTREGLITLWNPAAERVFGWTAEEVRGRPLPFIPEDKREEHRQMRERDLAGIGFTNREIQRRRKDGRSVDLSVSTAPLLDVTGEVVGIMSVYLDITERRRMEHELRESEAKFRALIEQSPLSTQVLSTNGRTLLANQAWERLWGVRPEQIADFDAFSDPQLEERGILAYLHRARAGEAVQIPETLFVPDRGKREGEAVWVRAYAYPVRDGEGAVRQVVLMHEDVTEHRRTEEALRVSEARFRELAQAVPVFVWVSGPAGHVRYFNDRWYAYTGLTPEQSLGTGWTNALHPDDAGSIRQVWQDAQEREGPYEVECRYRGADGIYRWFLARALPVREDNTGRIRHWVGTSSDIHDRKRAEEALARQSRLTQAITNNATTALFIMNEHQQCVFLNPAAEQLTGYSREEVQGKTFHEMVHHTRPDGSPYPLSECPIDRAFPENNQVQGEEMFVHKDGHFYPVAYTASPMREGAGIVGTVIEVQDISVRKQAEQERALALAQEQKARQTAELLNRVGPLLAVELDTQTLAQKVTDLATQLTGAQFGALFHNVLNERGESYTLYTLSGVPREAFSRFPMPRNTAVFAPTFRGEGIVRSDDITRDPRYGQNSPHRGMPEGHLPVRSYLAVPVISRSGEVLGGLFFGHSRVGVFTEQQEELVAGIAGQAAVALDNARLFQQVEQEKHRAEQALQALQHANEELRRANSDLEQFAYSASHDLQEPLRMVSIYSQMLQRKYGNKLGVQGDEYISYTVEGATRMEHLVRDLLAYTRASAMAAPTEPVNANETVERAMANLRTAIQQSGATVTYAPLPVLHTIHAVHLEQLFQNLIGNAMKYRSREAPRIHITAERRKSEWLFSVTDNGIGIDPRYKEQIFGIFKRLHTSAEYAGTGMGLAICHRIVERAGGRIWVESQLGGGSTFFFTLPDEPERRNEERS